MIQTKKKSGFTLVELMVFFVFISLVLAATAPIITKRVKHVPDKIQHGKFICEEGGRQQHYYNASQLISTQNVSKCTFKAPKKNSLFKIELIGGGAGGYDYTKWEETNKTQAAGYSLYPESGPWGSRSIDPTPQQLLTTFGGARFRFSTKTGDAESGENVSILYSGIKSPEIPIDYSKCFTPEDIWDDDVTYCEYDGYSVINASEYAETEEKLKKELVKEPYEYYDKGKLCSYSFSQYSNGTPEIDEETGEIIKDEEGNIVYKYEPTYKVTTSVVKRGAWVPKVNEDNLPYCSVWEKAAANVAARIGNLATCNTADECYNIATPERAAQFRSWVEDEVPTGKLGTFTTNEELQGTGGVGGHTAYLFLDGKIDFCNYEQHPEGCGANCANLTDRAESCVQAGEINDYLNNLFTTYYVIGTVSEAGSCDVWGYKEESKEEATNWKEKLANFKKGSIEVRGKKGFDLLYYYAIKGWGKCATNSIRATGGDGGVVGTDGESVWAYKNRNYEDTSAMVRNGRNSDGLAGAIGGPYPVNLVKAGESAPGIQIPSIAFTTTLNVRTHCVGDGCGAGA